MSREESKRVRPLECGIEGYSLEGGAQAAQHRGFMRPLSFENLRRLVGRGKDRDEPSFKRSESFKRISIRKSYLDRGKRRQKLQKNAAEAREKSQTVLPASGVGGGLGGGGNQPSKKPAAPSTRAESEPPISIHQQKQDSVGVIGYGEWINGVVRTAPLRDSSLESSCSRRISGPEESRVSVDLVNGFEVLKLEKSPVLGRREARSTLVANGDNKESFAPDSEQNSTPSVSISLGRIWRDAVPVSSELAPCAHHSLDSGLKERKPQPTVARTVSAPEKCPDGVALAIRKSKQPSTQGQGFAFSLSISRLAAFRRSRTGFFRKKTPKPAPSVSPDGYFKRTAAPPRSGSSVKRKGRRSSTRKIEASRKNQPLINAEEQIKEPPRSLSPVWFVPPERRRSRRQRRVWREIRCSLPTDELILQRLDDDAASGHSDEFDDQKLLLSGDFNERPSPAGSVLPVSCGHRLSSSSSSSAPCSAAGKISDFNEDKLVSEELRVSGALAKRRSWQPEVPANYFASHYFASFLAKDSNVAGSGSPPPRYKENRYRCSSCSSESDSEIDPTHPTSPPPPSFSSTSFFAIDEKDRSKMKHHNNLQFANGQRRRPLRRRSQLRRGGSQPVYLIRKCSSLRRRPRESLTRVLEPIFRWFNHLWDEFLI